jgi:hypothetical protein
MSRTGRYTKAPGLRAVWPPSITMIRSSGLNALDEVLAWGASRRSQLAGMAARRDSYWSVAMRFTPAASAAFQRTRAASRVPKL